MNKICFKENSQLILNPVENYPSLIEEEDFSKIHGLYVSDKLKNDQIVKNSIIGFSGRNDLNEKVLKIYEKWNKIMKSKCFSMRLLSGLHAHIILFMGLGNIGDKVMILPINAGGHYATPKIMRRLGYEVLEAIPDNNNFRIDIDQTIKLINEARPKIIFIDRSEGIYYEDFTKLLSQINYECIKVFDASQYLTNIIVEDFISPFDMGFDIIMSTLHKNFPGPQKAIVCSKNNDYKWERIQDALSSFVSSIHIDNIIIADKIIEHKKLLNIYSNQMLENSNNLEKQLLKLGLPLVERDNKYVHTHHLWMKFKKKDDAFNFYKKMEKCNILVNYRKLPYNLGFGIRLGTSAATLQGLNNENICELSSIILEIYKSDEISKQLINRINKFLNSLVPLTYSIKE